MIVVKVEVWPYGEEGAAYEVARAEIANVGGDMSVGEYEATFLERGTTAGAPVKVDGLRHVRRRGVWPLIADAISHMLGRTP